MEDGDEFEDDVPSSAIDRPQRSLSEIDSTPQTPRSSTYVSFRFIEQTTKKTHQNALATFVQISAVSISDGTKRFGIDVDTSVGVQVRSTRKRKSRAIRNTDVCELETILGLVVVRTTVFSTERGVHARSRDRKRGRNDDAHLVHASTRRTEHTILRNVQSFVSSA